MTQPRKGLDTLDPNDFSDREGQRVDDLIAAQKFHDPARFARGLYSKIKHDCRPDNRRHQPKCLDKKPGKSRPRKGRSHE
jgi:hypothetical protein